MIKRYSFFGKWRKKDVEFLNDLQLNKTIKEGYDGFWVEEGNIYNQIVNHFSKKGTLFSNSKSIGFQQGLLEYLFLKKN